MTRRVLRGLDGRFSIKRHLNTAYGLTPEQYRTKWGLPSD
ncbi:MucR family transcriptional regulator, partial [Nocardioides sp. NPDC004968]